MRTCVPCSRLLLVQQKGNGSLHTLTNPARENGGGLGLMDNRGHNLGCFARLLRFFFGLFNEHARLTAEDGGLLAEDALPEDAWRTDALSGTQKIRRG